MANFKQYINGQLVDGAGASKDVLNPADDSVAGSYLLATADQATEALEAAQKAFKTWSKTPLNERIDWLNKFREAIIAEKEYIIDLLSAESGKPYTTAMGDFMWSMGSLQFYAEEVRRVNGTTFADERSSNGGVYHVVEHRPIGVVVGHLAWNYPLGNAGLKLGPSIASGCCCILKPSSDTPLATLYLGEIAHKIGLPAGVVNIISGPSGEVAKTLNESKIPRMLTLIGSSETGRQVMKEGSTSIKTYSLELGGCAPVIIMPDADIELAASNTVGMKTSNTGQMCTDYNRIFVHEDIYDEYVSLVKEKIAHVKLGAMRDSTSEFRMGPMITRAARDRALGLVKDAVQKGAKLLYGGNIPAGREAGNWIEPTMLVDVTEDMIVYQEEIFAPIISIIKFNDLDKALEMAVDTPFGLTSYLYTHDSRVIAKCFEAFESGEVSVNGAGGGSFMPHAGIKESGIGCDSSKWSLMEYYNFKRLDMKP